MAILHDKQCEMNAGVDEAGDDYGDGCGGDRNGSEHTGGQ